MEQEKLIIKKAIDNINRDVDLNNFNADEGKELLTRLLSIPEVVVVENASEDRIKLTEQYICLIATFTCSDGGSKSDYYASALSKAFEGYGLELPSHASGEYGKFVEYVVASITANALRASQELALHQKLVNALMVTRENKGKEVIKAYEHY
ncbi:hypothetical protein [Ligilactobacillus equi]|uniref:Uncharacterized protein n=1 Tax=Ligilactobacillus equi DSM 15833 = JCM 10991 TaxID=1423740 RepID=A0A0R1TK56_9LACO|nr:hypothetical protein [Ligilactobacillus equi]KRL79218.1 hypothetical protein FC36_GL000871 [Ligilactobacillus equi DSM 15833 = JCM 10991]